MRIILIILWILISSTSGFEATWESLDSRELPAWYDEEKVGILVHFGIYSATVGSEWFWMAWNQEMPDFVEFMRMTKSPSFTYQDFVSDFKAELFDAQEWVELFEEAGAKYVILTAKHHDGFTLYPSSYSSNWNSVDVGPHMDFVLELSEAVRDSKSSMKFGIYYSLMEWFHPLYLKDKNSSTDDFVSHKIIPELTELVKLYDPEIIFSDGDWEMTSDYWKSKEFLAGLFNNSVSVVVNDRWGKEALCKHGSYLTCSDRYNPKVLQKKKFENVLSLVKNTWGFDPMTLLDSILTTKQLVRELITTIACNGNLLISVGPNKDGRIENIYADRLKEFGRWLKINSEGVYRSRPWEHQNEGDDVWFTVKNDKQSSSRNLYIFVLEYPFDSNAISLKNFEKLVDSKANVSLLGFPNKINVSRPHN